MKTNEISVVKEGARMKKDELSNKQIEKIEKRLLVGSKFLGASKVVQVDPLYSGTVIPTSKGFVKDVSLVKYCVHLNLTEDVSKMSNIINKTIAGRGCMGWGVDHCVLYGEIGNGFTGVLDRSREAAKYLVRTTSYGNNKPSIKMMCDLLGKIDPVYTKNAEWFVSSRNYAKLQKYLPSHLERNGKYILGHKINVMEQMDEQILIMDPSQYVIVTKGGLHVSYMTPPNGFSVRFFKRFGGTPTVIKSNGMASAAATKLKRRK